MANGSLEQYCLSGGAQLKRCALEHMSLQQRPHTTIQKSVLKIASNTCHSRVRTSGFNKDQFKASQLSSWVVNKRLSFLREEDQHHSTLILLSLKDSTAPSSSYSTSSKYCIHFRYLKQFHNITFSMSRVTLELRTQNRISFPPHQLSIINLFLVSYRKAIACFLSM